MHFNARTKVIAYFVPILALLGSDLFLFDDYTNAILFPILIRYVVWFASPDSEYIRLYRYL